MDSIPGSSLCRVAADQLLEAASGEALAVAVQEQRRFRARRQKRPPFLQVMDQRRLRGPAENDPSLFRTLAPDQHLLPGKMDVGDVRPLDLRKAHPAGVKHFQNSPVPDSQRRRVDRDFQQPGNLPLPQEARQGFLQLES